MDKDRKRHLLAHMVKTRRVEQVLVFTRTKRGANRLAEQLGKDGIAADAIHGNKSQSQRVRALTAFKSGRSQVLVATDVAARGIDIESLPHVVNFELPNVPEDYVHRIGRTGRAGQDGTAISLVSADEHDLMFAIEKLLRRTLEREVVEGFEPQVAFRSQPSGGGRAVEGERRSRQGRGYQTPPKGGRPTRRQVLASTHTNHRPQAAPGAQGSVEAPTSMPGERLTRGRPAEHASASHRRPRRRDGRGGAPRGSRPRG